MLVQSVHIQPVHENHSQLHKKKKKCFQQVTDYRGERSSKPLNGKEKIGLHCEAKTNTCFFYVVTCSLRTVKRTEM